MRHGSRAEFAAIHAYTSSPQELFHETRGTDFDIEADEWLALAFGKGTDRDDVGRCWLEAALIYNMWATTVLRPTITGEDLEFAGASAWREEIEGMCDGLRLDLPEISERELAGWGTDRLLTAYAVHMGVRGWGSMVRTPANDPLLAVFRSALMSRGLAVRSITEVSEYLGDTHVEIAPARVTGEYDPEAAIPVVNEWCEFFSTPSPIEHLTLASRTAAHLFAALAPQRQLRSLEVHGGDYADLSAVAGMTSLRVLKLGSGAAVTSAEPLGALASLEILELSGTRRVRDYSALGRIRSLRRLSIVPDGRPGRVDDLEFVRSLPELRHLSIGSPVDSGDFRPLLECPRLERVRILKQRYMTPSYDDLVARIPALRLPGDPPEPEPPLRFPRRRH